MQLHGAHLHGTNQRFGVVDDHHWLARELLIQGLNAGNRQALGVFLEKQFAVNTVRRTHQRHRAILELRQNPLGDAGVILSQLHFGRAAAGIDDPIGVGDAHLALLQADL
ncbi:hypothetical protein D3C84_867400 [compost metagenome]